MWHHKEKETARQPRGHAKVKTKLKTKFRSGSVERDEGKVPFNLTVDESRSRSYSYTGSDSMRGSSPKPGRKSEVEALRVVLSRTSVMQAQQLQNSVAATTTEAGNPHSDRKVYKKQPTGTTEYIVQEGDTLVKIGAHFDVTPSELMKVNKLLSRTVFVGQILYIPDSSWSSSGHSTPRNMSPVQKQAPQDTTPLIILPSEPGHVTPPTEPAKVITEQVTGSQPRQHKSLVEESDKKFLKMPSRRVLEEGEKVFTVKGTLLVTPNIIMFDPDVCDPVVISRDGQQKLSAVVYMEEVRSVALFRDISPRMFWRQPKELRACSPKPEAYRVGHNKKTEGQCETDGEPRLILPGKLDPDKLAPDGADNSKQKMSSDGAGSVEKITMTQEHVHDSATESGRSSDHMEHAPSPSIDHISISSCIMQNSRSSELEVSEINQHQEAADLSGESRDFGPHMGRSSSEVHNHMPDGTSQISESSLADKRRQLLINNHIDSNDDNLSTQTHGFEPVHFTDISPRRVTTHPTPVPGQKALVLSHSPILSTDVNEHLETADMINPGQLTHLENKTNGQSMENTFDSTDDLNSQRDSSIECQTESFEIKNEAQKALELMSSDVGANTQSNEDKTLPSAGKNVPGSTGSWTEKAQTVVGKLAFQVSNLTWESDRKDGSPKLRDSSSQSSYSPLRTPAHHISSFFNYTSNLIRGTAQTDLAYVPLTISDDRGKNTSSLKFQLKSEFTKEDMSRALGPDPKEFLLSRSDSHHFEDSPFYLQIRHGIQKNMEILQPRAFDHWNSGPMLNEYWFVIPRDMGDNLYNFLMTWQPDAYGDEEETESRGKFFYNAEDMGNVDQPLIKVGSAGSPGQFFLLENHFKEAEKTWEILSKEEVYGAEKEQAIHRQDTIDESNIPELIGPTVIIKQEHVFAILRSLPRSMSVGYNWELVYATHKHGYSLQNLYMRTEAMEADSPVLLFIMDTHGTVFGAYLSNTIRPNDTFYGSGATFLFTFYPEFKKFPWCGDNEFFLHGTKDFFAIGSGEGLFGLWLDSDLNKGRSRQCSTFFNDVLAREEDFSILQLEVWRFVDNIL